VYLVGRVGLSRCLKILLSFEYKTCRVFCVDVPRVLLHITTILVLKIQNYQTMRLLFGRWFRGGLFSTVLGFVGAVC
jgi:hypothetical protein